MGIPNAHHAPRRPFSHHRACVRCRSSQHPLRRRQTLVTLLDILKQRDIAASMLHILHRPTIRHVSTIGHLGASQVAVETEGNTRDEDAHVRIYVSSRL